VFQPFLRKAQNPLTAAFFYFCPLRILEETIL
jgi:hypothetical protein